MGGGGGGGVGGWGGVGGRSLLQSINDKIYSCGIMILNNRFDVPCESRRPLIEESVYQGAPCMNFHYSIGHWQVQSNLLLQKMIINCIETVCIGTP